jgi:hypothetical protein
MKTNDKRNDIEQCKSDIIYFVKNIMQLELKPHEELLLKNLVEAKKNGKDLVFLPYRAKPLVNTNNTCEHCGYTAKYVLIDEMYNN